MCFDPIYVSSPGFVHTEYVQGKKHTLYYTLRFWDLIIYMFCKYWGFFSNIITVAEQCMLIFLFAKTISIQAQCVSVEIAC